MRLIQFLDEQDRVRVARVAETGLRAATVSAYSSIYELAFAAIERGRTLEQLVETSSTDGEQDYPLLLASGRMLPPLTHPDPAHCLVSGTGLTHFGSAATRDAMHLSAKPTGSEAPSVTDSMQMFLWGVEGGRPAPGRAGAQPEWFYKGNGRTVVACGQPIVAPEFALDCGEEPEVVGLYVIAPSGIPVRLGYSIGNDFSDHITERRNYLYLAHSKLRQCSVGPELRTGPLPPDVRGISRIRRGASVRWEKEFLTGEDNMCHSLANLEFHHFKYPAHRVPGDVHLHFFGTATLSFADGIRVEPGDTFEIELPALGAPLVNTLAIAPAGFAPYGVQAL
ncbi:MAG TPA: AraD1 family protein [Steroidobacteraceae bacterium]|nr:AraD1 family protein [Steroidobacteraceae bacterium]